MEVLVLLIGVTWVAIGGALAVFMGRRGFDAYSWFVLGTILGPLGLVIAVYSVATESPSDPEILARPGRRGGPVDVLVGFDGSPESSAALRAAHDLFGSRVGRLTLARAVPHTSGWELEEEAKASLVAAAHEAPGDVGLEILHGRPAPALTEMALAGGYDVIAVGTRGAGLSTQVLGSAATDLARDAKLPVLLVGGPRS
jgi:nucleotide-binding universal stress UspA family protein